MRHLNYFEGLLKKFIFTTLAVNKNLAFPPFLLAIPKQNNRLHIPMCGPYRHSFE